MSLDAVIRDVIKRYPEAPAHAVALRIAKDHTAAQIEAYFIDLVAARIDDILRLSAATARNDAFNSNNGNRYRSWKHGQGRSAWQRMCDSTVWVDGEKKRTGACNREDLVMLISVRRDQISHLNNQLDHFEQLIELLDRYDVKYVDEIPEVEEALA